ncbi:MAG: hypothetical protein KY397_02505 [Gemmatimonadetes bacterium]|nr:hypothetical protein [Gemmatimonadota bacterium]
MQIVDAGMIAFAAWHALKGRIDWPLVYQVPRMLRPLVEAAEDTYVLCWNGARLWKRERWPAYRDRPEIWEEADREDFDRMLETLTALGVVQYRTEHLEADEAIAALVHRFEGEEELVIRSDDKDFMQLLSGSTRMEGRVRGTVRFTDVKEILGVTPAYAADYLALSGDQADGIPRIVPPKKARELIDSRGHVRDWIDRDLRIDAATKRTIEASRDQIRLNLELVDLSQAAVEEHGAPGDPLLDGRGDLGRAREIGERTDVSWLTADDLSQAYGAVRAWGERTRERLEI